MKLHRLHRSAAERRGAALLLSFLVLIVILMISYQITRTTSHDQIETTRDVHFTAMDLAIQSAFMQIEEDLITDAEAAAGGEGEDPLAGGGDPLAGGGAAGGTPEAGGGEEGGATDSQMDEWYTPSSTTIGEKDLRIVIEDEDRKFNILNMLAEDEEVAEESIAIVTRIIDLCREDTRADINASDAAEMARAMLDYMTERSYSDLPRSVRLTAPEVNDTTLPAIPMTLREFVAVEPFADHHFRDFFDQDGRRVHSLGAYLTIWTSPITGTSEVPEGGFSVNVNTAPLAVLTGLFDSRALSTRAWEEVIAYRNEEEPVEADEEAVEPAIDEFGNEIVPKKIFDTLDELDELSDFKDLDAELKPDVLARLKVESAVFSVYITARVPTGAQNEQLMQFDNRQQREFYERSGRFLTRTVRRVYWRQADEEGTIQMVPLVNWDVLDYTPLEVLDYSDDRW